MSVNRHLSRTIAMQSLYEWNFHPEADVLEITHRVMKPVEKDVDIEYLDRVIKGTAESIDEIDGLIAKAAPEWPLERISSIDRNILRLGLAELLYADRTQVPAKVAINEAIELAKTFGSASSGRFVNGVLGAVYVELGEPGKSEGVARKKDAKNGGKMPVEELVGAIVYAREKGEVYLALVHDIFGHWTLSKGRLQEDESQEDGVKRKAKEEMGLEVSVDEMLGENEYIANDSESGGKKRRHATYYLAHSDFKDLILKRTGGLDDAQWFPLAAVGDLNFYDDILPVVTRAINLLAQKVRK